MSTPWQDRAACRHAPDDFVVDRRSDLEAAAEIAAHYCARCPVIEECREYADACSPRAIGVWAGTWRDYSGKPVELLDRAEAS